ncbi:MAG: glycosyltransferase family 4 protein [Gammaproteobacteria bacterium]|nr:glycosyltransferase family 4 protein [Gammaproteobacteria bacterium]
MKVILLNRFFYPDHSATSQLLGDLVFDLAARGASVTVITSRQRIDDPDAGLPSSETVHGVDIHRVWTTSSGRASMTGRAMDYATFYLSAGLRLLRECEPGDLVLAKTDPPLLSVPCAVVAKVRGGKLINWLQDLFPELAQRMGVRGLVGWTAGLLRMARNASLNRASVNVALGDRMSSILHAEGVDPEKIRVIHNWCDGNLVQPVPRNKNALRKSWGLNKRFVVMYSGNLGRAHEFETMVAAARILRPRSEIVFLVVGDGVRRPWLEHEASRRGLRNFVFKPYQPRDLLAQSLSAGDVHVISLRPDLEGLIVPSKFYGVAAAGRPTLYVGSPDGEIPRILAEGACGTTVTPGDGEGLADEILRLAENPQLRAAQGRAARRLFEARFDKDIALSAWRELLGSERIF